MGAVCVGPSGLWALIIVITFPPYTTALSVAGHIILLKEVTAIREYRCHEGVYLVCNNV